MQYLQKKSHFPVPALYKAMGNTEEDPTPQMQKKDMESNGQERFSQNHIECVVKGIYPTVRR